MKMSNSMTTMKSSKATQLSVIHIAPQRRPTSSVEVTIRKVHVGNCLRLSKKNGNTGDQK